MRLPIFLALFGFAFSVPLTSKDHRNADLAARYVLPGESIPTLYDIQLFLNPDTEQNFNGRVDIRIIPTRDTQELVLHAMAMTITEPIEVHTQIGENIAAGYTLETDDSHLLRISLSRTIQAFVPHTIKIRYLGTFAENMFGVYLSTYLNETSGATE